jgi:hypothetical protein
MKVAPVKLSRGRKAGMPGEEAEWARHNEAALKQGFHQHEAMQSLASGVMRHAFQSTA